MFTTSFEISITNNDRQLNGVGITLVSSELMLLGKLAKGFANGANSININLANTSVYKDNKDSTNYLQFRSGSYVVELLRNM